MEVWSCSGTPVDCVKLALDQFLADHKPDLIIGGINHGDNSSVNNHYSGTMGVAKEGCMQHIPSIAFSSCNYDENADLTPLHDGVLKVVKMVLEKGLPEYTCLNVNFPALPPFKGFKGCRMTHTPGSMRWIIALIRMDMIIIGWWVNTVMTNLRQRIPTSGL